MGKKDEDNDAAIEEVELNDGDAAGADDAGGDWEDDGNSESPAEAKARAAAVRSIAEEGAGNAAGDGDAGGGDDAGASKAAGKEDGKGEFIPKGRFNEVNQRNKELQEQNAELLRTLAAIGGKPGAGKAATDDAAGGAGDDGAAADGKPAEDLQAKLKDLRKQRLSALASGDDDKALELDDQIETLQVKLAEDRAVARIRAEQQRDAQVAEERELKRVGAEAKKKYPQLDGAGDQADEDAIAFVIGKRDALVSKGFAAHKALQEAVDTAAKLFGWDKGSKDDAASAKPADKTKEQRDIEARTRNASAANRQPPVMGGQGERSTGAARKNVAEMTDAEFNSLSKEQLEELGGNR